MFGGAVMSSSSVSRNVPHQPPAAAQVVGGVDIDKFYPKVWMEVSAPKYGVILRGVCRAAM